MGDVELILSHRRDNGDDAWATPDGRIYVGNPFSTLGALSMLHELGVEAGHEAVAGGLERVLAACRDDGRIRLGPRTPMYPCYTAEAARVLCRFGLVEHPALDRTVAHLLETVHDDGGWRCSFSRFGKGPETVCSNPGATLYALDVLRHRGEVRDGGGADAAVETLLDHWEVRAPRGPCHWGIGTSFLRVEYPFWRYNLFSWVYILSFFPHARRDARFREAAEVLAGKVDRDGSMIVEHTHPRLRKLAFCAPGSPSVQATARYREIRRNLDHTPTE